MIHNDTLARTTTTISSGLWHEAPVPHGLSPACPARADPVLPSASMLWPYAADLVDQRMGRGDWQSVVNRMGARDHVDEKIGSVARGLQSAAIGAVNVPEGEGALAVMGGGRHGASNGVVDHLYHVLA
jgi:hypothetical protein